MADGAKDDEGVAGCLGVLFVYALMFGGFLMTLYFVVRFVKWAWAD